MGVYIKGMDMPKDKAVSLLICSSGNVYYDHLEFAGEAVPVPPHGRLIDVDALIDEQVELLECTTSDAMKRRIYTLISILQAAPIVINDEEEPSKEET